MSKDFWKLMDWWENHKECDVRFAVNSNLGQKPELFEQQEFIDCIGDTIDNFRWINELGINIETNGTYKYKSDEFYHLSIIDTEYSNNNLVLSRFGILPHDKNKYSLLISGFSFL